MKKDVKRKMDEEYEKVEAMGSDSEKTGVQAAKSILKEEEKKRRDQEEMQIEALEKLRKKKHQYIESLAELLLVLLSENSFPDSVLYEVGPTDEGVYMELYIRGRMFAQAFKVSGIPFYDLNAVNVFVERVEETVYKQWKSEKTN